MRFNIAKGLRLESALGLRPRRGPLNHGAVHPVVCKELTLQPEQAHRGHSAPLLSGSGFGELSALGPGGRSGLRGGCCTAVGCLVAPHTLRVAPAPQLTLLADLEDDLTRDTSAPSLSVLRSGRADAPALRALLYPPHPRNPLGP